MINVLNIYKNVIWIIDDDDRQQNDIGFQMLKVFFAIFLYLQPTYVCPMINNNDVMMIYESFEIHIQKNTILIFPMMIMSKIILNL